MVANAGILSNIQFELYSELRLDLDSMTLRDPDFSTFTHFPSFPPLSTFNLLEDTLQVDALGALNGQAESAVPDELCKGAKTTRDAEGGGVVKRLVEAVVVEEDT